MEILIYTIIFAFLFFLFSSRILGVSFFGDLQREENEGASEIQEEALPVQKNEAKSKVAKKSSKKRVKKSKKKKG